MIGLIKTKDLAWWLTTYGHCTNSNLWFCIQYIFVSVSLILYFSLFRVFILYMLFHICNILMTYHFLYLLHGIFLTDALLVLYSTIFLFFNFPLILRVVFLYLQKIYIFKGDLGLIWAFTDYACFTIP